MNHPPTASPGLCFWVPGARISAFTLQPRNHTRKAITEPSRAGGTTGDATANARVPVPPASPTPSCVNACAAMNTCAARPTDRGSAGLTAPPWADAPGATPEGIVGTMNSLALQPACCRLPGRPHLLALSAPSPRSATDPDDSDDPPLRAAPVL
ncbi:hypothetical protein N4G66_14680 [Streptomyces rhizosphaerihabitans]|nr:hypothetical protein [Streptomyces rhizosphaerihabitans]MCT9006133.1 hypothetical protein [Streptomyces rhizosphaerihabitans]